MADTPKTTAVFDELKTALESITVAGGYNYAYSSIVVGSQKSVSTVVAYPIIEIRPLFEDSEFLANQTYQRRFSIYIIVSNNVGSGGKSHDEKLQIIEKMKQDILIRLNTALVENEFTVIELLEFTRTEHSVEQSNLVQGGLALVVQIKHLYTEF